MLGIITVFASSVNRLLSFRMGDVVVKYAGQYLALGQKDKAAAVIKAAGITEGLTSITAYLVLALLTPLAAKYFVHDSTTVPWILFYGLSLLGALIAETSTAVLQVVTTSAARLFWCSCRALLRPDGSWWLSLPKVMSSKF